MGVVTHRVGVALEWAWSLTLWSSASFSWDFLRKAAAVMALTSPEALPSSCSQ